MQHDTSRVQHPPELRAGSPGQALTDVFVPVFGRPRPASAGGFYGFPHRGQDSRARGDVEELLDRILVHETVNRGQLPPGVAHLRVGTGGRGRARSESFIGGRTPFAGARVLARGGRFTVAVSVVSAFGVSGTGTTPTTVPITPVTFLTPRISRTSRDPGFQGRATRTTSRSFRGGLDGLATSAGACLRCVGAFLRPVLVVSPGAAESPGVGCRACKLSSCGFGSMDATGTGVESGSSRRLTSLVPSCCRGS